MLPGPDRSLHLIHKIKEKAMDLQDAHEAEKQAQSTHTNGAQINVGRYYAYGRSKLLERQVQVVRV